MKKRVFIILFAALLLLCACQPTPEEDAVKQKNTNVLIDTVVSQQEQDNSGQSQNNQSQTKTVSSGRFQCDFVTSIQNVNVTADISIEVLSETGVFPTLRVEHRYLSDRERLTLSNRLLNSQSLFVWEYKLTRAQIEDQIRSYMHEPTLEEKAEWMRETDSSEEDWNQYLRNRQKYLETLQKQYNELPENDSFPPLSTWNGVAPVYSEDYANHRNDMMIVRNDTDTGDLGYLDHVTVWANEMDRPIEYQIKKKDFSDLTGTAFFSTRKEDTERISPNDYDRPHEDAVISPRDAYMIVQSCFEGIGSFRIADIFWTNNGTENEQGKLQITRRAYFLVLTTDYFGANTPYCDASVYDINYETNVVRSWANETLMAVVDGDGNLISLAWAAPLKATDVIAEQTQILSKDEMQSIFMSQIGRQFAEPMYRDGTLRVDTVQLGLYRIREQNSFDTGLLVPAWFFTGTFTFSESVQSERKRNGYQDWEQFHFDNLNPVLIINAIDGTIIDPQKGY